MDVRLKFYIKIGIYDMYHQTVENNQLMMQFLIVLTNEHSRQHMAVQQ
jgi:hypothetical protein